MPPNDLVERARARYAEPHRRYHTFSHVVACREARDAITKATLPEVDLALLFHDAIYDPLRADNEARSAELLVEEGRRAWMHEALLQRAAALVLATRLDAEPESEEACVVRDADLSILGAAPDVFDAYERDVRAEYAFADDATFALGRAAILEGILSRGEIYETKRGRALWEPRARANLERSLAALRARRLGGR